MRSVADLPDLLPLFLLRYDSANTRRSYAHELRSFFGSERVTLGDARAVTFVAVNEYAARLQAEGKAPRTVYRAISVLRAFYGWLIALGLTRRNPADKHLVRKVRIPDFRTRKVEVLSREDAIRLIDAVDGTRRAAVRDRALLLTLLVCCLRRGEAAAMDFEHLRRTSGCWVLDIPEAKGGSDQWVKVPEDVAGALLSVREAYGYDEGPVWRVLRPGPHEGRRLSDRSIGVIVGQAAERAGLPPVSPHVLRHTGCTLALEGGASIIQVQQHARHRSVATTLVYVHQRDVMADSAADYIRLMG